MDNLKTLKDLILNEHFVPDRYTSVSYTDLKRAAIEHIKIYEEGRKEKLEKQWENFDYDKVPEVYEKIVIDGNVVRWIKWFFNIDEEELK
jgi:hypothetical protein